MKIIFGVSLAILLMATPNRSTNNTIIGSPHFRRVGWLEAPCVFHHLHLRLNATEIQEESDKIFNGLVDAWEGYIQHGRVSKVQAAGMRHRLDRARNYERVVRNLVFWPTHQSPKQNSSMSESRKLFLRRKEEAGSPEPDDIIDSNKIDRRPKRQVLLAAGAAILDLGLGVYNLYEIQELKAEMSADHECVIRMSQMYQTLHKTLFSVVKKLNTEQYGSRVEKALLAYHHFWRDIEGIYLAVIQGNAVPILRSAWFRDAIQSTLDTMVEIGVSDGCVIQPELESLLLFRPKGLKSSFGLEVFLPVACVASSRPLFKLDHLVQLAGKRDNKTTIYDIITEERYLAVGINEVMILTNGDMIGCEKIGKSFFCASIQQSRRYPEKNCIFNLWTGNASLAERNCHRVPSKTHSSFVQNGENEYTFFERVYTQLSCVNGSMSTWDRGISHIVLDAGCEIRLGSGLRIVRLRHSTTTITSSTEAEDQEVDILEFLDDEVDELEREGSFFTSPAFVITNHVMTAVHLAIIVVAIIFIIYRSWVISRERKRKQKLRQLRMDIMEMKETTSRDQ